MCNNVQYTANRNYEHYYHRNPPPRGLMNFKHEFYSKSAKIELKFYS